MINLSDCKRIHCIGIGGIGMSAIAEILLERGFQVSGSDMKESEMVEKLIASGAEIFLGHRAKNVEGADLVVYTAAVSDDNPEIARARELGIPAVTRAQMLGRLMSEYDYSIAVSGTHGKTTTTSMVSLILKHANKAPTILVGGNLAEIGGNVEVGSGQYFVTEACEYRDSFLSLCPKIEIILNIDSDHLDYFKDIDHIVKSFDRFSKLVPEDGTIIAYNANPFVNSVVKDLDNVITFGFSENCTYYVTDIEFNSGLPKFTVNHEGRALASIQLAIPGEHNILNSLASFACCHMLGVDVEDIVSTLENFSGTQRRFDIKGQTADGRKIIDDYAHHPTEIKATLAAAVKIPHNSLWCLFQPHTYTRKMALLDDFASAFDEADKVVLAEIYAAREKNIHKISSKTLMNKIKEHDPGKDVYFFEDFEEIASFVYNNAQEGDLVITMGAGDIYKVGEMILDKDKNR